MANVLGAPTEGLGQNITFAPQDVGAQALDPQPGVELLLKAWHGDTSSWATKSRTDSAIML